MQTVGKSNYHWHSVKFEFAGILQQFLIGKAPNVFILMDAKYSHLCVDNSCLGEVEAFSQTG